MNRRATLAGVVLFSSFVLAACALSPCHDQECQDDASLVKEVEALLAQHADLGPPNSIDVQAHNGIIYLHGLVVTDLQKKDAESVVSESPRVKRVVNMIGVDNNSY